MPGRFRSRLGGRSRGRTALPGSALFALCIAHCALCIPAANAAEVHVVERADYGGTVETLRDRTLYTGTNYTTMAAPARGGYLFTHWSSTATEGFSSRDVFGRALDAASFMLYDTVTLTANYVDESLDSDHDNVADGHELYWYGGLAFSPDSDTDADGLTFAVELAAGTNPLFPDRAFSGVAAASSASWFFNPSNYPAYTFRSDPEGDFFQTVTGHAKPGTTVTTPAMDPKGSFFAYWTRNGARQADALGRAVDAVAFTMPGTDVELVAVASFDDMERAALYWYGCPAESAPSDSDNDGRPFAEEVRAGTNPLFADRSLSGVATGDSPEWTYNPNGYHAYAFRSEPEGSLFTTVSGMATPGTALATPAIDRTGSFFAYWTRNGVRQADAFGRAKDSVAFEMPAEDVEFVAREVEDDAERAALYWYGCPAESAPSDSDGDGLTFAQEIAAGTNPLFPDRSLSGVETADSPGVEMNLQPYEQAAGAVVDGAFAPLFASPVSGAPGALFGDGSPVAPVVWDLNGDGLFDIVVLWKTGVRVYVNVGTSGNPEFTESKTVSTNGVDLAMNDTAKLGVLSLDVPPVDALSATTNGPALLVSDADGRIWYYTAAHPEQAGASPAGYTLQHKVWGGSHPGFAAGLRLAAVDWEDDGDLDCLCGTADGRLMLLRDPRVGRPTNVQALVGADNVLLLWDPNAQSRIRGYRVYRSRPEQAGASPAGTPGERIAEPPLPTYRDFPPAIEPYDYRISSVSRFYTAGNSTPTESESMTTEAIRANLGVVELEWRDAACLGGGEAEVRLAIGNSLHAAAAGAVFEVTYDPSLLTPVEVRPSGLTEGAVYTADTATPGVCRVSVTGGEIAAGSGTLFAFAFRAAEVAAETNAAVMLASATLYATSGAALGIVMPGAPAAVAITPAPAGGGDDPTVVAPWSLGDLNGDGRVDREDLRLMAKYKEGTGRKYGANEIRAGDFNGNGRLDNADYQALRALLKEIGVL